MGELNEFSLPTPLFLKAYPWRRIDPVPWSTLKKPLAECRLGLVSSAGFVLPGQQPFDDSIKGGDWSFREIANDTDPKALVESHRSQSFDHAGIHADANLALPLQRVNEMAGAGRIGSVNHRHFSFMGSIVAPGRFLRDSVPVMADAFVEDAVDVALFVPV